jgi:CRISPR/Cas system-associated exonuclease Cas4 (RecB family)
MSGSGFAGYAACPGKFQLELTCPPDEGNAYTEMGNRIHEYLAGEFISLSDDEQAIADKCLEQYKEITTTVGLDQPTTTSLEKRLWYGTKWSGAIDRIDFSADGRTALIVDWKTGRNPVGQASGNLQARAYAVLVAKNCPTITKIFVAIIQPMAAPYSITEYDEAALRDADDELALIVTRAEDPNAPRVPSPDACKYCRAKSICPEAQGEVKQLAEVASSPVPALSNDQIADFLEKSAVVEAFIDSLKSEAKKRLQDGQKITGYKLMPGRISRSIDDPMVAFERLGLDPDQFLTACKVSIPSIEKVFASTRQLKAKEAKAEVESLLGDCVQTKTSESIMTRTK